MVVYRGRLSRSCPSYGDHPPPRPETEVRYGVMKLSSLVRTAYQTASYRNMSDSSRKSDLSLKTAAALLFALASLLLTVLNVVNHYWFMTGTTSLLTVGFLFSAVLSGVFKKRTASTVLMAVLVAFIFSTYALTGGNEGFAILWILLVPSIGMTILDLRVGTALGAYFQLFLIVLFYTPLRRVVSAYYTSTFMVRFPILYLTSFAAAVLLSSQRQYYYHRTESLTYLDMLTGLYNRRYYELSKERAVVSGRLADLTIISMDINRLKHTNDTFGHQVGDRLIISACACMSAAFPDAEAICRTGGDEFAVLTFVSPDTVRAQIDELIRTAAQAQDEDIAGITFSIGAASHADYPDADIDELERIADTAMYESKANFYTQTGYERRR